MFSYSLQKIVTSVFSLFFIITLTFFLMQTAPGDPLEDEKHLPSEVHERLRAYYGLNQPLFDQYVRYVRQALTGNLPPSMVYENLTVNDLIRDHFPISCQVGLLALSLALFVGTFGGIMSAYYYGNWEDKVLMAFTTGVIALPNFLLGVLLQYVFAFHFELLPGSYWGGFSHSILPALALAAFPAAFIYRLSRSSFHSLLAKEYIKTALAKGLSWPHIFLHHCLRNGFIPIVSYLGQIAASILTGSFVIEKIFNIPGLGQWLIISVSNRDYPLIMGLTIFYSVVLLAVTAAADILIGFLNPQIAFSRRLRFS